MKKSQLLENGFVSVGHNRNGEEVFVKYYGKSLSIETRNDEGERTDYKLVDADYLTLLMRIEFILQ